MTRIWPAARLQIALARLWGAAHIGYVRKKGFFFVLEIEAAIAAMWIPLLAEVVLVRHIIHVCGNYTFSCATSLSEQRPFNARNLLRLGVQAR